MVSPWVAGKFDGVQPRAGLQLLDKQEASLQWVGVWVGRGSRVAGSTQCLCWVGHGKAITRPSGTARFLREFWAHDCGRAPQDILHPPK